MPELPEVETTRRGISDKLIGATLHSLEIRNANLRWPINENIKQIQSRNLLAIERRGKYLIFDFKEIFLIVHLGMSGSLRLVSIDSPENSVKKHDHVLFSFSNDWVLHYHDPRRFGSMHVTSQWHDHFLLMNLGPEPIQRDFNLEYLQRTLKERKTDIYSVLMNSKIVAGIGNIYANEILFESKIHPLLKGGSLNSKQISDLIVSTKSILKKAIAKGGTTLRDFVNTQGNPGYFSQNLFVYGRENEQCQICSSLIVKVRHKQRSIYFCPQCQEP